MYTVFISAEEIEISQQLSFSVNCYNGFLKLRDYGFMVRNFIIVAKLLLQNRFLCSCSFQCDLFLV